MFNSVEILRFINKPINVLIKGRGAHSFVGLSHQGAYEMLWPHYGGAQRLLLFISTLRGHAGQPLFTSGF